MNFERLKLRNFRNLKDVEVFFPQSALGPDEKPINFRSHAIIGENGSGKSNLLEAIITIFRDLDLDEPSTIDYELEYRTQDPDKNSYRVKLVAEKGKRPSAVINGEKRHLKEIRDNPNTYLPAHIFAYYSGKNERVEELFQSHLHRFNERMRLAGQEQVPSSLLENFSGSDVDAQEITRRQKAREARKKKLGEDLLRRLFYCRGGHTQLVLLACFLSEDEVFKDILEELHIEEIDSALFVLKQPHYLRGELNESNIQNGDSRFWFAAGTVVSEFLTKLWEVAIAPIDETVERQIDFRGRKEKQEQIYLLVPSKQRLKELGEKVGTPESFFRYSEGAYIADLIEEVRIKVKHRDVKGNIAYRNLSEGELQLLTVLGLMRITSQDNCLFILDEPDTHLNPIWKLRYFDQIENVLRPDEGNTFSGSSQIIITTHDPLMIGSLRKEQVHILRCEGGVSKLIPTTEHPQGMGVAGLLKSELFGLRSTVDTGTRRRLDRRNYLYALEKKRTKDQNAEMAKLSEELSELGFASDFKDPYLDMFVKQMALHTQFHKDVLTPEEQAAQDKAAGEIIDKILAERKKA